jgi:hypothetical protein
MAEVLTAAFAPELVIGEKLIPHVGSFMMVPFIMASVVILIIGIIVFSTGHKTAGGLLLMLGASFGGLAFYIISRVEGRGKPT